MNKIALYPEMQKKLDEFRNMNFTELERLVRGSREDSSIVVNGVEYCVSTDVRRVDENRDAITV